MTTWVALACGLRETVKKPRSSPLRRVIGEAQDTGTAARADQMPPGGQPPSKAPTPDNPADSIYPSMADLNQRKYDSQQPARDDVQRVLDLWQNGSKAEAADYILRSNVAYADLIRLMRMLDDAQALELGTILDELAPAVRPKADPNLDLVDATAGNLPEPEPVAGPNTPKKNEPAAL